MTKFKFYTIVGICLILASAFGSVCGQYHDVRCKCVCPMPGSLINGTVESNRKLYIHNVHPNQCNCDYVVLPQLLDPTILEKVQDFCPRCECKYESRDTYVMQLFVTSIIVAIIGLTLYMVYLAMVDHWIPKANLTAKRKPVQNVPQLNKNQNNNNNNDDIPLKVIRKIS